MYLNCYLFSHDHFLEVSCEFISRGSLRYVTTMINLATISTVRVEICSPLGSKCLKGNVNLRGEISHGESPPCHV